MSRYSSNRNNSGDATLTVILAVLAIIAIVVISIVIGGLAVGIVFAVVLGAFLQALVVCFINFVKVVLEAHGEAEKRLPTGAIAAGIRRLLPERQPARIIYALDTGWWVMRYTATHIWEPTQESAGIWFKRGSEWRQSASTTEGLHLQVLIYAGGIGAYMGGMIYYPAVFLNVLLFIVLQSFFLSIAALFTGVLVLIVSTLTNIYGRIYRIYYRCPVCHEQMTIPVHYCPHCDTAHTRLWPSIYGLRRHVCLGHLPNGEICNARLPTLDILGRKRIIETRRCPKGHRLKGVGEGTNIHIPIVGGPSAGKSHFITMAVKQFIEDYAPKYRLNIAFPDESHERDYSSATQLLETGQRLPKTSNADDTAPAFLLKVKRPRRRVPNLLYVYDLAGENIATEDEARKQGVYFQYIHGALLIIDPFSIPSVRSEYSVELRNQPSISPSPVHPERVYQNMLTIFEERFKLRPPFNYPIAVVITKVDSCGLEDFIGEQVANKYLDEHHEVRHFDDAMDLVIRDWLTQKNADNFIRLITPSFTKVRFFSTSAVGADGIVAGTPFQGVRTLSPLLWLLSELQVLPSILRERVTEVDDRDRDDAKAYGRGWEFSRYYIWDSLMPKDL